MVRVAVSALLLLLAQDAWAQRGYEPAPTPNVPSRLDGFPGLFDAGTLNRGQWQVEYLPWPGVRYGLTPEASIKVSAVPLLSLTQAEPGIGVEIRHRMFSSGRWIVAGTLSGNYADSTSGSLRSVLAGVAAEWRRHSGHSISIATFGGRLSVRLKRDEYALAGLGAMLSSTHFFGGWFGVSVGVGHTPVLDVSTRSNSGETSVNVSKLVDLPVLPRLVLYLRIKSVLFGVGVNGLVPNLELSQVW